MANKWFILSGVAVLAMVTPTWGAGHGSADGFKRNITDCERVDASDEERVGVVIPNGHVVIPDGHRMEPSDVGWQWWSTFDDALLDSLMDVALANNCDVLTAARRVQLSQLALMSARSAFYPQLSLGLSWTADRTSGNLSHSSTAATHTSFFGGAAQLSWEIDVFGKVVARSRAAEAQVRVSRAEREAVMLSMEAQLADAYFNLRVYQAQLQVAESHALTQNAVLDIALARYDAGLASMLDVSQAREVFYSTRASIPMLVNSIHTTINSIAVLVGDQSDELTQRLERLAAMPGYVRLIGGVNTSLSLMYRPDVIEAERQIDVCALNLGVAKKDYLPTLSLAASVGVSAHRPGDMLKHRSLVYSLAPTLSWTAFDGFSRRAAVETARRNIEIAVDNFNQTLLTARTEVDNALTTYANTLKYIDMLGDVVTQSARSEELSLEKYKRGLAPFINVANAQMSYLENQNSLIVAQGQALTALVNIYKSLGGLRYF